MQDVRDRHLRCVLPYQHHEEDGDGERYENPVSHIPVQDQIGAHDVAVCEWRNKSVSRYHTLAEQLHLARSHLPGPIYLRGHSVKHEI